MFWGRIRFLGMVGSKGRFEIGSSFGVGVSCWVRGRGGEG